MAQSSLERRAPTAPGGSNAAGLPSSLRRAAEAELPSLDVACADAWRVRGRAGVSLAGCDNDDSPTGPDRGALVTFQVVNETFRVWLPNESQVEAARAAQAGDPARIPNGRIVAGTEFNTGWSWHLEDVEFAAVTTEVCDGLPSDVQREGPGYGGGRFCPWGAVILNIDER